MIPEPRASSVNSLCPVCSHYFSLQDFLLEGFFSKSSVSRTGRIGCGLGKSCSTPALPGQAGNVPQGTWDGDLGLPCRRVCYHPAQAQLSAATLLQSCAITLPSPTPDKTGPHHSRHIWNSQSTAQQTTLGDGAHGRAPLPLCSILPYHPAMAFLTDVWMIPFPVATPGRFLRSVHMHTHTHALHTHRYVLQGSTEGYYLRTRKPLTLRGRSWTFESG